MTTANNGQILIKKLKLLAWAFGSGEIKNW